MNNKAFTISIGLAGIAVFMVYSYITAKEQEFKNRYGTETAVVVAKTDIKELSEIHGNMIEIVSKPKRYIEPGSTNTKEEVDGFIAAVGIRKGEQITLNKIIAPGVRTGLSRQVTMGKRAVSIAVNDLSAVNRLLKPGDRIDLVATIDAPGSARGGLITKILLQDVPVLAVGEYVTTQAPRKIEKDDIAGKNTVRNLAIDRNFSTIVVEVSPSEAIQLMLLQSSNPGSITVLLRNNDDTERVVLGGTTLIDVLGSDVGKIIRATASQR